MTQQNLSIRASNGQGVAPNHPYFKQARSTPQSGLPTAITQTIPRTDASKNLYLQVNYYEFNNPIPLKRYIFINADGDFQIDESQTANYVSYSPLSRSSELFSYTGSKSRSFSLTFTYSKSGIKPEFTNNLRSSITQAAPPDPKSLFFKDLSEVSLVGRPFGQKKYTGSEDGIITFIDSQLQIIRSLTINNAKSPTQGPPLVRINFGILYQDVPCICTDYVIKPISKAETRINPILGIPEADKISITLTLKEIRTGDYLKTDFAQAGGINRDNLVGWEQLFNSKTGSFDPVNPIYT